jgi:hypothetical protein
MTDETPENGAGVTVTLKGGKGFEAPWLVFRGTPAEVRANIIEACQYNAEQVEDWDLIQMTAQAASSFQAMNLLVGRLGGPPLQAMTVAQDTPYAGPAGDAAWDAAGSTSGGNKPPWNDEKKGESKDPLIAAIEAVGSKADLGMLWKDNKDRWAEPEVAAAAKAAGARVK